MIFTKPVCRGQYSIQKQINGIIKAEFPNNWSGRIKSPKFREAVRKKLLATADVPWCDYQAGKCACDPL